MRCFLDVGLTFLPTKMVGKGVKLDGAIKSNFTDEMNITVTLSCAFN